MVAAFSVRESAQSDTFSATELTAVNALQAHQPSVQSHHAQTFIIEPTLYEPHHGDGRATEGVANTLAARMGTGGNNTPVLVEPEVFVKSKRAQSVTDDETWKINAPHPTLNQFDQGDTRTVVAIVEPSTVRRLTPTECERLQGFPDGWTEGQADSHRYKQMGNAVAVPVVEWVIQGIMEVMNNE
jgi:DNA (cytosine-5)-methyltransferase 1